MHDSLIVRDEQCVMDSGWLYTDTDHSSIKPPTSCNRMLSGAGAPLSILPHPAFQAGVSFGEELIGLVEDVLLLNPYSFLKVG